MELELELELELQQHVSSQVDLASSEPWPFGIVAPFRIQVRSNARIMLHLAWLVGVHVEFPRLHAKGGTECGASLVFGTRFLPWRLQPTLLAVPRSVRGLPDWRACNVEQSSIYFYFEQMADICVPARCEMLTALDACVERPLFPSALLTRRRGGSLH